MSLSDYTIGDKAIWQAGRRFERERIMAILKEEQNKRQADGDWGVIGIVVLMQMIEKQEE